MTRLGAVFEYRDRKFKYRTKTLYIIGFYACTEFDVGDVRRSVESIDGKLDWILNRKCIDYYRKRSFEFGCWVENTRRYI